MLLLRFSMSIKKILLLGNPKLYEVAKEVQREELLDIQQLALDLRDTMMDFRVRYQWGRAIAAPQIGDLRRVIYMQVDEPIVFINPQIDFSGYEMMTLWDDCMSFPDLLVKVQRYKHCKVRFRDLECSEKELSFSGKMSELFQHELDHLNGVLFIDHLSRLKQDRIRKKIEKSHR